MTLADVTLALFTLFNGVRLISYFPQICRILRDGNGATAISYATWTMWCGCHIATGLYATVNLGDWPLAAASALYAACCLTVIGITAVKRQRGALAQAVPAVAGSD